MSKVNLKKDYEDGQILHGDELNVNNNVIELGVNDNFDRINNLSVLKADITYVDNQLSTKVGMSDLNASIRDLDLRKADKSALVSKADQSEVNTKASITYVDNSVAPKANKSYVDTQLGLKADMDSVIYLGISKADLAYVNNGLNNKANTTDVNNALEGKADVDVVGDLNDLQTRVKTDLVSAINSIEGGSGPIATTTTPGIVKPDGTTITVDQDGTIHSVNGGGGGGTTDYSLLSNKPRINNVELSGNKSLSDLGLMSSNDINTALNAKADSSNVYTKQEIDGDLVELHYGLETKADRSTTYTKTQVDSAIANAVADKADASTVNTALESKADKSNTYTKSQVDSAINAIGSETDAKLLLKANTADVYNKSEVNTLVGGKADNMTFSNNQLQLKSGNTNIGDPVTIEATGTEVVISDTQPSGSDWKIWIDDGQVNNLGSEVVNSLEGNEITKAPSVRAVNEVTKPDRIAYANDFKCKNLFNIYNITNQYYDASGNLSSSTNYALGEFVKVDKTIYTASVNTNINSIIINEFDNSKAFIKRTVIETSNHNTVTLGASTAYIRVSFNKGNTVMTSAILNELEAQLEIGPEATTYTPYKNFDNTTVKYNLSDYIASGLSIDSSSIVSNDGIVIIDFNISKSTAYSTNTNITICTLPEELRPKTTIVGTCVFHSGGSNIAVGYIVVNTNGTLNVRTSASGENSCMGNIVFSLY